MVHMEKNRGELADGVSVLPFSTSLGAHWEPWMIYREFYCNAKDEGGGEPNTSYPAEAGVVFCVQCKEVEEVKHSDHFLSTKPLATLGSLEIHPGHSGKVFYKGVAVFSGPHPLLHTYNFLSGLNLTEDRTVGEWSIRAEMGRAMMAAPEGTEAYLKGLLEAKHGLESHVNLAYIYGDRSPTFRRVVLSLGSRKGSNRASDYARFYYSEDLVFATQPMDATQFFTLASTLSYVDRVLSRPEEEVIYCSLDADPEYSTESNAIYLHPDWFKAKPTKRFKNLLKARIECDHRSIVDILLDIALDHSGLLDELTPAGQATPPEATLADEIPF